MRRGSWISLVDSPRERSKWPAPAPWIARIAASRPPLGPGLMAKYEHELGAFEGLGLDDVEIDSALTFLVRLPLAPRKKSSRYAARPR